MISKQVICSIASVHQLVVPVDDQGLVFSRFDLNVSDSSLGRQWWHAFLTYLEKRSTESSHRHWPGSMIPGVSSLGFSEQEENLSCSVVGCQCRSVFIAGRSRPKLLLYSACRCKCGSLGWEILIGFWIFLLQENLTDLSQASRTSLNQNRHVVG